MPKKNSVTTSATELIQLTDTIIIYKSFFNVIQGQKQTNQQTVLRIRTDESAFHNGKIKGMENCLFRNGERMSEMKVFFMDSWVSRCFVV